MVVDACLGGEPLLALSKKFDICRHLICSCIEKYKLGDFDDDHVRTNLVPEYEARIVALERLVGKQALEIELSQGGLHCRDPRRETRSHPSSPARWPLRPTGV